jgi:hypothetical protein
VTAVLQDEMACDQGKTAIRYLLNIRPRKNLLLLRVVDAHFQTRPVYSAQWRPAWAVRIVAPRSNMADLKAGEPFGLDATFLKKIDWKLVLARVLHDTRSDFIYAPHLTFIYSKAGDELIGRLKSILKAGEYPSDLFGDFYLAPIDRLLDEHGAPSARYVDDIYVFVASIKGAHRLMREMIPALRSYDLTLNEAKSVIIPKSSLLTEEPDLEALFSDAVEEISSQVDEEDFDADYGFQSDWEEDDGDDDQDENKDEDELTMKATIALFDSIEHYPGHEENIERFCLPLFAKASSKHAIQHVFDSFTKRPAMSQIYASYLARFLDEDEVCEFLINLLDDGSLVDWQKMWVLAALSQLDKASDASVKKANDLLKDGTRHEALRSVAAIYVGRYGDHSRRKALVSYYNSVSPYIQSAIYFSSRNWPGVERPNAKASWGSHGFTFLTTQCSSFCGASLYHTAMN